MTLFAATGSLKLEKNAIKVIEQMEMDATIIARMRQFAEME